MLCVITVSAVMVSVIQHCVLILSLLKMRVKMIRVVRILICHCASCLAAVSLCLLAKGRGAIFIAVCLYAECRGTKFIAAGSTN